jgi:hypothetical protein
MTAVARDRGDRLAPAAELPDAVLDRVVALILGAEPSASDEVAVGQEADERARVHSKAAS